MRDASRRARTQALLYYLSVGTLALDQLTKLIARLALREEQPVTLIPGLLDLRLSFNSGAAFGVLPNQAGLHILVALVTIYAIVKFRQTGAGSRALSVGLGLLLGGAIGNLIDRLASHGRGVTDFISAYITLHGRTHAWPTFNVADIGIVAGAVLVLFSVYIVEKSRAESA